MLWGRVAKYELWKAEEKLESQRLEVTLRRTTRQLRAAWHDMGPTITGYSVTTERDGHHRRAVGPGYGAQAGTAVVDKYSQT